MKDVQCVHYAGDGYGYDLRGGRLYLCEDCNMMVASGMMAQLVQEHFLGNMFRKDSVCKGCADDGVIKPLKEISNGKNHSNKGR